MALMRIQKFLSEAGISSRRKAEEYLLKGLIKINGKIITELGTKVDSNKDKVYFKDKLVKPKEYTYVILNKPVGYVTSFEHKGKKTIKGFLTGLGHLAYAGRLDEDSRGLILLSNDGNLINELTHPKYEHEKEYVVEISKEITDQDLEKLSNGIYLEEGKTKKCKITKISNKKFKIILEEGWNRQIRRMLEKMNYNVIDLQRIRIQTIELGDLKEGKYRYLTKKEIELLKK